MKGCLLMVITATKPRSTPSGHSCAIHLYGVEFSHEYGPSFSAALRDWDLSCQNLDSLGSSPSAIWCNRRLHATTRQFSQSGNSPLVRLRDAQKNTSWQGVYFGPVSEFSNGSWIWEKLFLDRKNWCQRNIMFWPSGQAQSQSDLEKRSSFRA